MSEVWGDGSLGEVMMKITVVGALAIIAVAIVAILIVKALIDGQNQDPQSNETKTDL